jgi:hypothetical protein
MTRSNLESSLRSILKRTAVDVPSHDFTDDVMHEIEAESEVAINHGLKALLDIRGIKSPASNFAHVTMRRIEAQAHPRIESIVPRLAWYIIAAILMTICVTTVFTDRGVESTGVLTGYLLQTGRYMSRLAKLAMSIDVVYVFTIAAGLMLVLADLSLKLLTKEERL